MTPLENSDDLTLDEGLLTWIKDVTGASISKIERRPGGGRREAWYVDIDANDGSTQPLFLRYDRESPADKGDPFTLHREAQFYKAFDDTSVPVPRILGVHPTEQAILSTRVPGYPWFSALKDDAERIAVASDFMKTLAAMHSVDPHRLELPDQDADMDLPDLIDHEIDVWESIYRGRDAADDPLIELGLRWLRDNRPDGSAPVVIVQGDTGPGNFLYENGRVTAVLDLEMGHLGDPHDDLAWVSVRAVQEPFTNFVDRLGDYAAEVPWPVDINRIKYFRVFAELRIVILGHQSEGARSPLAEVGNMLAYGMLHRRLLIDALSDVLELRIEAPPAIEAGPGPNDFLYHSALEQIRQIVVPRSEDAFVIARSKGIARILKYLRQSERFGPLVEAADLSDINQLLSGGYQKLPDAIGALSAAHIDGAVTDAQVVGIFARQVARQTEMLRPVMGVLAERRFDPLT